MKRTTILLVASGACAVLAVVLALFARDVGRWPQAIRSGDVAAAGPARPAGVSWTVDETLPFSPARQALGVGDDLVLAHSGAQRAVDLLVDRVDHRGGVVEQRDLVDRLDGPRLEHHARAVGDVDARALERLEGDDVRDVDAELLALDAVLAHLVGDAGAERVGHAGLHRHRSAHRRHAGPEALGRQPRRVHLVMAGGRAEVPEDRVALTGQEDVARVLVARPLSDVRARDVADVVGVEEQQRSEVRRQQGLLGLLQALGAQTREVDALLPVDRHGGAARCDVHARSPASIVCSVAVNMLRNCSRLASSASS